MPACLGIDTSNYTTSAAVYDPASDAVVQVKRLLTVRSGERGLRQSDALFQHTRALPELLEQLCGQAPAPYQAIGVSVRPRDAEGSYMPCFLAGVSAARAAACAGGIPCFSFSHQCGHIAAALYSAHRLDLVDKEFIAFHVSGGTTEALLVHADRERILSCRLIGSTLDLNAGQAIDRVGVMMGLDFPCGPALEQLALKSSGAARVRPVIRGCDCSLSGVENQCRALLERGEAKENVARFCLDSIGAALDRMAAAALAEYGPHELVFSGGVMSNSLIRAGLTARYPAFFAQPAFSCDNAAGTAVLAAIKSEM